MFLFFFFSFIIFNAILQFAIAQIDENMIELYALERVLSTAVPSENFESDNLEILCDGSDLKSTQVQGVTLLTNLEHFFPIPIDDEYVSITVRYDCEFRNTIPQQFMLRNLQM